MGELSCANHSTLRFVLAGGVAKQLIKEIQKQLTKELRKLIMDLTHRSQNHKKARVGGLGHEGWLV